MKQASVTIGTHGEQYGNWMSNPVFYVFGAGIAMAAALTILSFLVFHLPALGIIFGVILIALAAITCWFAWIRKQYSFSGGGMMGKVHQVLLSHLDFDGKGTLLEVGCGSGALTIRSALTWPECRAVGIDYWGAIYNYSKALCEKNAASEGVGDRCTFQRGDANKLDFPDETFDAVISNYVYHNITNGARNIAVVGGSYGGLLAMQLLTWINRNGNAVDMPSLLIMNSPFAFPETEEEWTLARKLEKNDLMVSEGAFRFMMDGVMRADPRTPAYALYPDKMDFRHAPETYIFYAEEACACVADAIAKAYARDGAVLHMHREPGMMHCYACAPVFPESKRDYHRQIELIREL